MLSEALLALLAPSLLLSEALLTLLALLLGLLLSVALLALLAPSLLLALLLTEALALLPLLGPSLLLGLLLTEALLALLAHPLLALLLPALMRGRSVLSFFPDLSSLAALLTHLLLALLGELLSTLFLLRPLAGSSVALFCYFAILFAFSASLLVFVGHNFRLTFGESLIGRLGSPALVVFGVPGFVRSLVVDRDQLNLNLEAINPPVIVIVPD